MSDIMELGFEALGGPIANNADKAKQKVQEAWNGQPSRSRSRRRHGDHHHQHIEDWQYQVDREGAPAPRVNGDSRHGSWEDWHFPPKQQSVGGRPQMQRRASSLDRGMGNYYSRSGPVERYRPQPGRDYDRYYQTSDDSDSSYSRGAGGRGRGRHQSHKSEDASKRAGKEKDKDEVSTKDKVKNKLKGNEALVAGIATVGAVYAGSRVWSAYQNDKKKHEQMKKEKSKRK